MVIAEAEGAQRVLQASENAAAVLGIELDHLLSSSLAELFGAPAMEQLLAQPRTGPPAVRPKLITLTSGTAVVAQVFAPTPALLGIELERAAAELPSAISISRYSASVAHRLAAAHSEQDCLDAAIDLLREVTGFERVWAYRFEPDGHGVVVAERRPDALEPFLGLHFPESDIPPQARRLYLTAGVRLIGDTARSDVPLVPELLPDGARTDLSGTDLRGVSPMHVRYLRNMGVRTSMSVPIVIAGELWGLLSGHHYSDERAVSALQRSQCETLGTLTAMQLGAVQRGVAAGREASAERHLRKLAAGLTPARTATDGLVGDEHALLGACNADGALVALGGEPRRVGVTLGHEHDARLIAALGATGDDVVVAPGIAVLDAGLSELSPDVCGVLAICLSRRHGHWVVWTRRELVEHVTWANRDRGLVYRDPEAAERLGAQRSFEQWADSVRGSSAPWTSADVRAAEQVRAAIGAYAFHHAEQLRRETENLSRANKELDAFAYSAAHDLQQPVRAISLRTEFLIDDAGDRLTAEERESAQSILRLTEHMSSLVASLLDYARLDFEAQPPEHVHLADVLADVRELLGDAGAGAEVTHDDAEVTGDPQVIRHVVFNLVWNAIKYTDRPPVIHIGATKLSAQPPSAGTHIALPDGTERDVDVLYVRDNGIGVPPEQLERIFGLFRRLHGAGEYGGGSGAGLALCRRLLQRSGGAIWATSEVGAGSTFYFTTSAPEA